MKFSELNVLQKYLTNRVSYESFKVAYAPRYEESYIESLYDQFVKNPVAYITDRCGEEFFDYIIEQIETTNYKG